MKIIDVHNHLYPKDYLDFLNSRSGSPRVEQTGPTAYMFWHGPMRLATITNPGHYDWGPRVEDMEKYGIDIQVVSLTTPGVELLPNKEGIVWAKKVNDRLAEGCREHKGRFYALAALPYQDVEESVKEIERCRNELGARGITMFSNIAGEPIYESQFLPIYEAAAALDMPIFIHPGPPLTSDVMKKARMPLPLYGFILDTTMAVTGLIFEGIIERFPALKIIHAHLGGIFPYMVGRIDDCYNTYKQDFGFALKEAPSEYYRRNVWDDAISFHLPSMRCCLEYMGIDHMVIGTDYAHPIGGPDRVVTCTRELGLSEDDIEKIMWKNAAKLFEIERQ
jgi:predicted TIM-barrel fold metal-dependent hydrolase